MKVKYENILTMNEKIELPLCYSREGNSDYVTIDVEYMKQELEEILNRLEDY